MQMDSDYLFAYNHSPWPPELLAIGFGLKLELFYSDGFGEHDTDQEASAR